MNTESSISSGSLNEPECHPTPETGGEAESSTALRPGRPSKRTPELEAAILECLQLGLTIAETCDVCGVSETQFRVWRQHYPEFAALVRRGQAEAVKIHLSIIREAAGKRWQASAWWLERRRPDRWGKASRTFEVSQALEFEDEDREQMVKQIMESRDMISRLLREREEKEAAGLTVSEIDSVPPADTPATPAPEDNDTIPSPGPAGSPAPGPNAAGHEAAGPQTPQSAPPEAEKEAAQPAPAARRMPSVFLGGPRDGNAASFDEADESTHVQNGYRLMTMEFSHGARVRLFKVFGEASANENFLRAQAANLLYGAGNRAVAEALAAQGNKA